MDLKEIKDKIINGDLKSLFYKGTETEIHPSDVAKILKSLPVDIALNSFEGFSEKKKMIIFPFAGHFLQAKIIQHLPEKQAADLLDKLNSDDRYSFFISLKALERSKYLEYLNDENKKATLDMLGYPKQSIARLVNTDFATITESMTIAEANEHLRKNHTDSVTANVIYVVDENGKLLDDVPVRRLVLNEPTKLIRDIMDHVCLQLNIDESTEEAIHKFKEYDRTVLPVTNTDNLLLGVVTVDDVMDVAEQRSTREMQKFGGVESLEYPYVHTPIFSLIKKRAGWLIILFLSEMLTATAMGYFEVEIAKAVVLALFVPLVISSGGNSGSQAATLIIRAMAVKELNVKDWWYVMRREILSGVCLGAILGAIGFLRITVWQYLHWYNYGEHWILMAITIFFSLIGIVLWGTLSGSMIPMLLKRLKLDPATSSAPFVATLVDVTGLVIYFSIAAIMLKGTLL
ncbi:magnesium transporter [Mucilaginibacter lappiensis]|jgi:magnesium transporter|uniref:magnesium transporter n=1 Tax=Mucilaginibacter lappiensis TaxID=354630 RepID=UPI003D1B6A3B